MRRVATVLLLWALVGCAPKPPEWSAPTDLKLQITYGDQSVSLPLGEALEKLPSKSLTKQNDMLFGEPRAYQGWPLEALAEQVAAQDADLLVLYCRDGYISKVPMSNLRKGEFVLAYRDPAAAPKSWIPGPDVTHLAEAGNDQTLSEHDRDHLATLYKDLVRLEDQGPFYPVFVPGPQAESWAGPFAVERIEFEDQAEGPAPSEPPGVEENSAPAQGYQTFKKFCISCHAVNGDGGVLGPELNRPMNVTEYFNEATLRQMMKDPTQVRENSKMAILHLPDGEVDKVVAYLKHMRSHKK